MGSRNRLDVKNRHLSQMSAKYEIECLKVGANWKRQRICTFFVEQLKKTFLYYSGVC